MNNYKNRFTNHEFSKIENKEFFWFAFQIIRKWGFFLKKKTDQKQHLFSRVGVFEQLSLHPRNGDRKHMFDKVFFIFQLESMFQQFSVF